MTPIEGRPILTAAQMRAAEDHAIAGGASVESLMERAGAGVAEAVRRLAAGAPVLVLCGPGNNGGDGYVAARVLRNAGVSVSVAALAEPKTAAARAAFDAWGGPVKPLLGPEPTRAEAWASTSEPLFDGGLAPVVVDAIFGTGLSRPLEPRLAARLNLFAACARLTIAVDLPSGVNSDTGALLGDVPWADVTLALGNPKPAHLLPPAAQRCGAIRMIDIGLTHDSESGVEVATRPAFLGSPSAKSHKYSRGMVAVIAGTMAGAAEMAAQAALRAGAGYALLLGDTGTTTPHAIVRRAFDPGALDDRRIGAILVGPGLGRDAEAERRLDAALAAEAPLVIDGDALHLLDARRLARIRARSAAVVLTPHAGEFDALFGRGEGSRIERTFLAVERSGAAVVFKGSTTIIAAPMSGARVTRPANPWLSTAGTGDILAGTVAALLAGDPTETQSSFLLETVAAAVWMHAEAARRLGGAFIADDLARELSAVRAAL